MAWCRQARFVLFSTINGYRHFHNRPLPNEQFIMNCIPETGNRFDINAMLVVAPPLHEVPVELRDAITRHPRLQHARDIVSRPIGRVPRHLSLFYSSSLTDHHALKIESFLQALLSMMDLESWGTIGGNARLCSLQLWCTVWEYILLVILQFGTKPKLLAKILSTNFDVFFL